MFVLCIYFRTVRKLLSPMHQILVYCPLCQTLRIQINCGDSALASVALLGHDPIHPKVASWISGQGTYP